MHCLHLETSIIRRTFNVTNKTRPDNIKDDSVNPLKNLPLIEATLEFGNISLPGCGNQQYEIHSVNPGFYITQIRQFLITFIV